MSEREWEFYLDDMIKFCKKVLSYTEQLDQKGFETDEKSYDATLRKLELLGEAATHIPDAIRESSSSIPWRQVVATRNRLIHGYLGIDNDILWSIIQEDIPVLLQELEKLKGERS
ncbi:MAG: nucleotidyltransferase [Desulfobulbaceae bacterium BRH_c16a]|nr:MAG: nucleotidyltransferase [Desulfobulbaceae bacterium BRH_c16a]